MEINNLISMKIWEDRYRKNNETLDGNLRRVAKHVAKTNAEEEEFYEVMDKGLFLFAGRTMSNAGIGSRLTLNNCFVEGSKVITKRGFVNIEDIKIGDEVITHDNTWQVVNDVMCRDYVGDLYKIKSHAIYDDITCTPNHKFLTQNGWKRADRLLHGGKQTINPDRLKVANLRFAKTYDTIDITKGYTPSEVKRVAFDENGKVYNEVYCKNKVNTFWQKRGYAVNRFIEVDEDFRYFIGRWIGDGSVTRYKGEKNSSIVQIVFNATTEKESAERCIEIGTKKFGVAPSVQYTNQNVIAVRWCNEILGTWFKNEFGEKSNGKHLDDKYLGDFEIAKGLLDADATIGVHGKVHIVLKNHDLICWLKQTLYLNGINTGKITKSPKYEDTYSISVPTNMGKGRLNKHLTKTYYDERQNNSEIRDIFANFVSIGDIEILENISCKVYNISVENTHSYTVNGVVVHNCYNLNNVPDGIAEIFDYVKYGALTQKAGGYVLASLA